MKILAEQLLDVKKLKSEAEIAIKNNNESEIEEFVNKINGMVLWENDNYTVYINNLLDYKNLYVQEDIKSILKKLVQSEKSLKEMISLEQHLYNGKKYSFVKELGHGGNGTVYLIKDEHNNEFALKKINLKKGKKQLERFKDEITVVTKELNGQKGILPILDYHFDRTVEKNNNSWYIMPKAEAISCHIFKGIEYKISAFLELAKTLKDLHSKGITHRDIKPENLYYYENNFVFSDFGLTDFPQKTAETVPKERIGPWLTIAPEMERDPLHSDFKAADIYSFAKTLWMLLTEDYNCFEGQYSFYTEYMDLSRHIITRNDYDNGKKIYLAPLHDLLYACTSNNPKDRFSIEKVIEYLETWLTFFKEHRRGDAYEWKFLTKQLFKIPAESAVWHNRDTIYSILEIVTRVPYLNHTFLPGNGGLYLNNVKKYQNDYIEFDFGQPYIGKPKRLEFHSFNYSLLNYFYLVMDDFGDLYEFHKFKNKLPYEECVCEFKPGIFKDVWYKNYDEYNGIEVPQTARTVYLLNKGIYVIFCQSSPYNINDTEYGLDAYSAIQQKMNNSEKFKNLIELFEKEIFLKSQGMLNTDLIKKINKSLVPQTSFIIKENKKLRDIEVEKFIQKSFFYCENTKPKALFSYFLSIIINTNTYVFTTHNNFILYDKTISLNTMTEDLQKIENVKNNIQYFSDIKQLHCFIRKIKQILRHHFHKDFHMPDFYIEGKFFHIPSKRYFSEVDLKNALLLGNDLEDSFIVIDPNMNVSCLPRKQLSPENRGRYCFIDWDNCIYAHDNICGNQNLSTNYIKHVYKDLLAEISVILKNIVHKKTIIELEIIKSDTEIKKELDSL